MSNGTSSPTDARDWAKIKSQMLRLALGGLGVGLSASLIKELFRRAKARSLEDIGREAGLSEVSLTLPEKRRYRRTKRAQADSIYKHYLDRQAWAMPLMALAGIGGVYGGYRGLEWLLDKFRKQESEEQLQAAEEEFERALQEHMAASKRAARADLGEQIDQIYDKFEKEAQGGLYDWLVEKLRPGPGKPSWASPGVLGGGAITLAALLWMLSHGLSKKYFSSKDPEVAKMEAFRKLQRLRYSQMPPTVRFERPGAEEDVQRVEAERLPF